MNYVQHSLCSSAMREREPPLFKILGVEMARPFELMLWSYDIIVIVYVFINLIQLNFDIFNLL